MKISTLLCALVSVHGFSQTTLLTESFDGLFPPNNWQVIQNGVGANWGQSGSNTYNGSGCAYVFPSTDFEDTWLITPDIPMTSGNTYRVTYYHAAGTSCGVCDDASMKVTVGQGQTVGAQSTTLQSYNSNGLSYVQRQHDFVAPTSGNFNFAFHCYSGDAQSAWLRIDEVEILDMSAGANPCTTSVTTDSVTCNNDCDGSITISMTGGTPPFSVNDPVSGNPVTFSSVQVFNNLCAGNLTLTITDAGSCNDVQSVTIGEPGVLQSTATAGSDPSAPGACDGTATASHTGGTGTTAYQWIDCNNPDSTVASGPSAALLCDGDYAVVAADQNGCVDTSACVTLTEPGLGITETSKQIHIYPIPADDQLRIETQGRGTYQLIDLSGRVVRSGSIAGDRVLNTTDVPSGNYVLQLTIESERISRNISIHRQ